MKKIIQDIQARLKSFINGSRQRLLIISCAPENSALLLKTLDAIEDDPAVSDIFLTFGHPYANPESYAGQVLDSVRQQYEQVNSELAKRGDPPLAPLPGEVADNSLTPPDRLLRIIQHMRSIVPREQQVIWLFYPMEINEPEQYLQLIDFVRSRITSLKGVKLVVRDNSERILLRHLQDYPEVRFYQ